MVGRGWGVGDRWIETERKGGKRRKGGREEGRERLVQLPTKVRTPSRQMALPSSFQMRRSSPSAIVRECLVHMRRARVTRALVSQMPTRLLFQMSGLHNGIANKQWHTEWASDDDDGNPAVLLS